MIVNQKHETVVGEGLAPPAQDRAKLTPDFGAFAAIPVCCRGDLRSPARRGLS